jgi:hypothetical protein
MKRTLERAIDENGAVPYWDMHEEGRLREALAELAQPSTPESERENEPEIGE